MGGFSDVLGTLIVEIEARFDEAARILNDWEGQISDHVDKVKDKFSQLSNIGGAFTAAGAVLSGLTAGVGFLAHESLEAAGDIEAIKMALDTVTGSSAATEEQLKRLEEIAKLPGLSLESAAKGSLALQSVKLNAQEAERYLKAFGNAVAASGGKSSDLDAVVVQLRQMAATGKVASEDLKPILQRIPQVAAATKEAFGTIDTEVLAKAGVTAQDFLGAIVPQLEKIPPVAGGINNSFENLGDTVNRSLTKIGNVLAPIVQKAIPIVESLLGYVDRLVVAFTELPGPVQDAVLLFGGLVTALGPLLLAIGGAITGFTAIAPALATFAGLLGTTIAGLFGWAAALAAVVAGLVAVGVWINDNWSAIVAVVSQAWDGITEAWGAIWGGIADWFAEHFSGVVWAFENILKPMAAAVIVLWDPIVAAFQAVWGGISTFLSEIWEGIRSVAARVWAEISRAIATFLEWAQKIPGVNKLFNLDEAWNAAKKLEAGVKDATAATADSTATAVKAGVAHRDLSKEIAAAADSKKADKAATKAARDEQKRHTDAVKAARDAAKNYYKELEKKTKAEEKARELYEDMIADSAKLTQKIVDQANAVKDLTKMGVEPLIPQLKNLSQAVEDIQIPLQVLGIKSKESFDRIAADAQRAYDQIVASSSYSQWEKDSALLKLLEAQRAAMIANGQAIPAEMQKMLDKLNAQVADPSKGLPAQQNKWKEFGTEVSTIITNFTQDMAKSLFDGDLSWGEKAKKMLRSLGEAVVSSFVQPATAAITDLINTALKELLTGQFGLGAVWDQLKKVGDKIVDIFKATPSGGAAPSGGGGGGGGAGGGLGSVASGAMGWIGIATDIFSAVTGLIGDMRLEGTMNQVERNTAQCAIHLLHILENLNVHLPLLWAGVSMKSTLETWTPRIEAIAAFDERFVNFDVPRMIDLQTQQLDRLSGLLESQRQLNVTLIGTDPAAVATRLGMQLKLQGGMA